MTVAAMPNALGNMDRNRAPGFLDGIHLPNVDIAGMIGMQMGQPTSGPSVSTLKKSQSNVESRHPCVYQYGSCSFGDECKFADIDGKVCAKFLKGGCTWGNSCCWKHTTQNVKAKNVPMQNNDRRQNHRRMDDQAMQEDMYNSLGMSQLSNEMQQRNLFQQFQIQQQLSLPPNLLGSELGGLPGGMQGFQDENRFADQLQQVLPFSSLAGDNEPINHNTINQILSTISGSIREFDERHSERVAQLQMAIDAVERERNEECDRNRRSISALMSSVDNLMAKLHDLGVPFAPYNSPVNSGNTGNGNVNGGSNPMSAVQEQKPVNKEKSKVCQHCGKSGRLMLCGRCKIATFCNQECQREAWSTHAKTCQPPADK